MLPKLGDQAVTLLNKAGVCHISGTQWYPLRSLYRRLGQLRTY